MTRILVVDDEPHIRLTLAANLTARGYEVDTAADGAEALALARAAPPDAAIVDLGLPGIDGNEVIRRLRDWSAAPVIVLSVREREADKVLALDIGADDYVTKPFGMDELLARLRAALRRRGADEQEGVVDAGRLQIDLKATRATVDGEPVHLTPIQWRILAALARNLGRLVSQRELLQAVWGPQYESETYYLRVYMTQLRRKLEIDPARPRHLITESGMGYRLVAAA